MTAYAIKYRVNGTRYDKLIEAKDLSSAKKKIGKKHGYKSGRMVQIESVSVIAYF